MVSSLKAFEYDKEEEEFIEVVVDVAKYNPNNSSKKSKKTNGCSYFF